MRVIRLHGPNQLKMHNEPNPVPGINEELLKVTAVGVCGSDLHWFKEGGIGDAVLNHPLVLGHEFSAIRSNGQRVAVDPCVPCGKCRYCLEGNPNLCPYHYFAGHGEHDGALREWIAWPSRYLFPIPDNLSDIESAMLEPLGIAIHATDLGHLKPGLTVGVFGCGPIGQLIIQLARLSGATQIIATDRLIHRLDFALQSSATHTYLVQDNERDAEMWAFTREEGLDIVFEVAGENSAVETAVALSRPGGQVVLVGIPSDDRTSFNASVARRKGLTFRTVRRMKHTYPRAIRLVESGLINVRSLVTHQYSMDSFDQAFSSALRREGLKTVIIP